MKREKIALSKVCVFQFSSSAQNFGDILDFYRMKSRFGEKVDSVITETF